MPYIPQADRKKIDQAIANLIEALRPNGFNEGEMNYAFSKVINAAFDATPRYATINKIHGMLACVDKEFYRRKAAPYEDKKIVENGDI